MKMPSRHLAGRGRSTFVAKTSDFRTRYLAYLLHLQSDCIVIPLFSSCYFRLSDVDLYMTSHLLSRRLLLLATDYEGSELSADVQGLLVLEFDPS